VVSGLVNGGPATEGALLRFHGQPIQVPRTKSAWPSDTFVGWHRREVFREGPV
jgi:hypothetical protein